MSAQEDLEESLLLMLYEISEGPQGRVKVRQLYRMLGERIGETRIIAGLQHLQKLGLISGSFDNFTASGFEITRKGILYVEQSYTRDDDGPSTSWTQRSNAEGLNQFTKRAPTPPTAEVSPAPAPIPINIVNNFNPSSTQNNNVSSTTSAVDASNAPATKAGWWGAWGTWVGVVIALATLAWILHEAKVF